MNTYITCKTDESITELHITGNKIDGIILVDTCDVERLKRYQWYIKDKQKENHRNYVACKIGKTTTKLHRFLLSVAVRHIVVDHIDRDTFNNCKGNLRQVTYVENNHNTKKRSTNTSGRTGVYKLTRKVDKHGVKRSDIWVAAVRYNQKLYTKRFSINKYGDTLARQLADDWRKAKELEFGILTES